MARTKKLPRQSQYSVDTTCDFCGDNSEKIVDAPTNQGPWAHMCPECFELYGVEGQGTTHENTRSGK